MHRTLSRQLRRFCDIESSESLDRLLKAAAALSKNESLSPEIKSVMSGLEGFLGRVDATYKQYDRDLELRTRSIEIGSSELTLVNDRVRDDILSRNHILTSLRETANHLMANHKTGIKLPAEDDLEGLSNLLPNLVKEQEARQLELSNQRFAMDQHAIVSITDTDGKILYVNDKFCTISGYERSFLIGKNHSLINSGKHSKEFFADMWQTISAGKVWHGEICSKAKNGVNYWVDVTIVPFLDQQNKPYQYIAIRTEVTERKHLAEKIEISERQYRNAVNSLNEVIFRTDENGIWTFLNPAWTEITGFSVEDSLGQCYLDFVHDTDAAAARDSFAMFIKSNVSYTKHQTRYRTSTGGYRWLDVYALIDKDENGKVIGMTGRLDDITEQRNATALLRDNFSFVDALFESIPLPVYLKDDQGKFERLNKAFCKLFSIRAVDYMGKTAYDLLNAKDASVQEELERKLIKDGGTQLYEASIGLHNNNKEFDALYSKAALYKPDGSIRGIVGTIVDISDQKSAERALLLAKQAAESASRSKSDFLANMSHEIRTPMNSIMGMTHLVLDSQLDAHQREYLSIVNTSADALLNIINDILDFSKIEADKMSIESISFDLRQLILDTLRSMSLRAQEKNLELTLDLDPKIPSRLLGDPGRLRQVLLNLIGNAIKFTLHGEITVSTLVTFLDSKNLSIIIDVSDTGVGIPVQMQDKVFEAFTQEDGSTTRKFGGTGLGLSITKNLVNLMGGDISLVSEVNKGSVFSIRLDLDVDDSTQEKIIPAKPLALTAKKILLVDDNITNLTILKKIFERLGADTVFKNSGKEAIEFFDQDTNGIDCIILDCVMPELNGFETAAALFNIENAKHVPIIMLSSSSRTDDFESYKTSTNIWDYILKPASPDDIHLAVSEAINQKPASLNPLIAVEQVATPETHSLHILLVEDNPLNQKLATALLKKWGHHFDIANNGLEALEWHAKETYDLILMDLQMPMMGGYEATSIIRQREKSSFVKKSTIIAMTANALEGDREECIAHQMDDYVSKPFKIDDFQAILKKYVMS
jgi:two-component system, sensor histidine kinase and response regulator